MSQKKAGDDQARQKNGQFVPGVSGNPEGRPKGSRNTLSGLRQEHVLPILPDAIEKLTEAVTEGERWAVELVVSYSISKPKPVDPEEIEDFERRLEQLELTALGKLN